MKVFHDFGIKFGIYLLAIFILTASGFSSGNPTEDKVAKSQINQSELIDFLRPFVPQLRRWIWELSGEDLPSHLLPQNRAEYLGCDLCMQGLPTVRNLLATGISDEAIISILTVACQLLQLAPDPDICHPIIKSYAIPVAYMLRAKESMLTSDICGIMTPGCADISENLRNWNVYVNDEKPLWKPRPVPPTNRPTTTILQFTDIHLDLDYKETYRTDCQLPICCRETNGLAPIDDPSISAGPYGDYACGLPVLGFQELLNHAKDTHPDAQFIFLTGDYVHSGVWLYNKTENERHIQKVTEMLKQTFDGTPVEIYPLVGNHEPDVVNMYPPEEVWGNFTLDWMYEAVSSQFTEWLPPSELSRFKRYGYYSVTSKKDAKLRIVALNTNLCYINNLWLSYDPIDTFGQLQWFSQTMALAEKLHQNVFVIGHIYPGSGSCWPIWSEQFHKIVVRYEGIIRGQFYGHNHNQNYKLTFVNSNSEPRPVSVSYVGGSGLPSGGNPAYNVFFADGEQTPEDDENEYSPTWEILNHQTYILELESSNTNLKPEFTKLLDANEDYQLGSMSPEDIYELVLKMVCDDKIFAKYEKVVVKGESSEKYNPCPPKDMACRARVLSPLFDFNSADFSLSEKFRSSILSTDCLAKDEENSASNMNLNIFILTFTVGLTILKFN